MKMQNRQSRIAGTGCAALALAVSLMTPKALACSEPVFSASIPDGKAASESEMAAVQKAVKEYVSSGEAYIACLEDSGSSGSPTYIKKRNETIDGMERVAAQFNRELRQYRKNSG